METVLKTVLVPETVPQEYTVEQHLAVLGLSIVRNAVLRDGTVLDSKDKIYPGETLHIVPKIAGG